MGRLLLTIGDGSRQEHPVVGASVLGRSPDSDIRVDDMSVSRTHAFITYEPTGSPTRTVQMVHT